MGSFTLKDIEPFIKDEYKFVESVTGITFNNVKPIDRADENSLVWCSPNAGNKIDLIRSTSARFVVCDNQLDLPDDLKKQKNYVLVESPRLIYSRIIRGLFLEKKEAGIHPTAIIHDDAVIGPNVTIGPHSYIGKCTIGEGTVIDGNAYFYDNVTLGKNVLIEAGVVLGAQGFGQTQNKQGEWEPFPHIGGVEIHDNAFVGANTAIDRGTLGNTLVGKGSKVSKSVRVAHNVQIGKNCIITGGAVLSGSVTVGNNVWVGPNATLLNKIKVGNDVFIGIAANVTKNVPDNHQVIGTRIMPRNQ